MTKFKRLLNSLKVRNLTTGSKILLASLIPLCLVVVLSSVNLNSNKQLLHSKQWGVHTTKVLGQSATIQKLILDMETGQRGYLITGNKNFLKTYDAGKSTVFKKIDILKNTVSDNPPQVERLQRLEKLLKKWQNDTLIPQINARSSIDTKQPVPLSLSNKVENSAMQSEVDQMRALLYNFDDIEIDLLAKREAKANSITDFAKYTMIFGTLIIIAVSILFSLLIRRNVNRQLKETVLVANNVASGIYSYNANRATDSASSEISDALLKMTRVLEEVVNRAEEVCQGDLSVRLKPQGKHDRLSNAINRMIENLEHRIEENKASEWLKTGQAGIAEKAQSNLEIQELAETIISYMTEYVAAQVGVLYIRQDDGTLRLTGSYAYTHRNQNTPQVEMGQGLIGQAALEKKMICFHNVPDEHMHVASGLGKSPSKHIVVIPALYEGSIRGVIEIGSNSAFSDIQLQFFESSADVVAIALYAIQESMRTKQLLEKTEQQREALESQQQTLKKTNEELEEQANVIKASEEQLQIQQQSLKTTNEELEEQAKALQASEEQLTAQAEELRASNAELETQRSELRQQNLELEETRRTLEEKAAELQKSSKYKTEFLANMSHELRTPLNSLLMLSMSLAQNKGNNLTDKQVKSLQMIYSGGEELLTLINDILDLSKVEAGKLNIEVDNVNCHEVVKSLRDQFMPLATEAKLELTFNVDDQVSTLTTDKVRLQQILKNLLSNAIKFTKQGHVRLDIFKPNPSDTASNQSLQNTDCIAFSVTDTGIGIANDKLQDIFQAFQQADGTINRKYGGTGLGLTISMKLSQLLNGQLSVYSEQGKGSTFTLILPQHTIQNNTQHIAAPQLSQTTHKTAATQRPNQPSSPYFIMNNDSPQPVISSYIDDDIDTLAPDKQSILLIEDDKLFAQTLLGMCRQKGYQVLTAGTAQDGLHLAKTMKPSAIILDLGLPDIDGDTLLQELKKDLQTRSIPVHIITGRAANIDLLQKGAVGILQKPIMEQDLETIFNRFQQVIKHDINRILVIEDDPSNQTAIKDLLQNDTVKIDTCDTAGAASELISKQRFDCIVLDINLPDYSGIELLQQLSQQANHKLAPVIVYTGTELTNDQVDKLNSLANAIIIKGADSPERLLDEVTLFLHSVKAKMPSHQINVLQTLHGKDEVLEGKHILLVDDDLRNIFALSEILDDSGMEVSKADNGQMALEILQQKKDIDLVIMDIMMPIMDGFEAIKKIRAMPNYQALPVIALTAKTMPEDRQKCLDVGANDFLTKPVHLDRLLSIIKVWLLRQ